MSVDTTERVYMLDEWQVAERLKLSVHTLRAWRQRRQGPPYFSMGRTVRYSLNDLEAWLAEVRVVAKPKG